jgi:hypothetical protein
MALAQVHAGWAYGVFGGLGGVAGGVGGYFVEQSSTNGQADAYMLAGGLALVIPMLVLTLNATRYQPAENATEDHPPASEPDANPGAIKGSVVVPGSTPLAAPPPPPAPAKPPTSLLDVVPSDGLRLGVPLPEVRSMYTLKEQHDMGLPQKAELRLPVLSVTF